jgi:hypothetical protein
LVCDEGIISSLDGQSWAMTKTGSDFYNISANSYAMFAFATEGVYYRTTDGINWNEITTIPGGNHDFFMSCASDDGVIRAFALNYRLGRNQDRRHSMPAVSTDNGLTWAKNDSIPLLAYDADSYMGKYSVVGPCFTSNWEEMVAAIGDFSFMYPGGQLSSVHYFDGHCYTGGQLNAVPPSHSLPGFIMVDGNFSSKFFTGTVCITKIFSNRTTLLMAMSGNGDLFVLEQGVYASTNDLPNRITDDSNFRVYPNPTTGSVTVKTGQTTKTIEIRNLYGQLIKQLPVTQGESIIDLPQSAGIYLINGHRVVKQ